MSKQYNRSKIDSIKITKSIGKKKDIDQLGILVPLHQYLHGKSKDLAVDRNSCNNGLQKIQKPN